MKKSYTFSNLPMAAIVLLVASLPCLAQVTVNESSSALAADSGSTLAMNKTFRAVPPSVGSVASIEDAAVTSKSVERVKSPKLTPAMFRVSEESSLNSKVFTRTQLSSEVSSPDSKEQFRADDDTPTASSKVTFVPSRGFRLPTYDFKLPNN
jgi:hypothetical protein